MKEEFENMLSRERSPYPTSIVAFSSQGNTEMGFEEESASGFGWYVCTVFTLPVTWLTHRIAFGSSRAVTISIPMEHR
jgi:hypothetical protein